MFFIRSGAFWDINLYVIFHKSTQFTYMIGCQEKSAPGEICPKTLGADFSGEIMEKSSLLSNFTYIDVECYSHCSQFLCTVS